MIAHELATNATKYGALSVATGRVAVSWWLDQDGGMLRLRWAEVGGPKVQAPPARRGFGSRLIDNLVESQLAGTVTRVWNAEGLVCDIALPIARAVVPLPLQPGQTASDGQHGA